MDQVTQLEEGQLHHLSEATKYQQPGSFLFFVANLNLFAEVVFFWLVQKIATKMVDPASK